MNLAPVHSLCLLYRKTGKQRYLDMAQQIVDEFAAKARTARWPGTICGRPWPGDEFYQTPKPRWESLHPIMALAELYWITGEAGLSHRVRAHLVEHRPAGPAQHRRLYLGRKGLGQPLRPARRSRPAAPSPGSP